jgi:predicted nucleic acid-binding protein
LTRAAQIAERHSISVYDATYVATVQELGYRLVSCDEKDLVSTGLAILPEDAVAS